MWQYLRKKVEMPTADRALPGRDRQLIDGACPVYGFNQHALTYALSGGQ